MAFRGKTKKTPISKRPPCSEHRFSIFRCWPIPVKNLHSLVGLAAKLQIGRSWRPASGKLRSHVTKVVNLPPLYPHLFLFHCTKLSFALAHVTSRPLAPFAIETHALHQISLPRPGRRSGTRMEGQSSELPQTNIPPNSCKSPHPRGVGKAQSLSTRGEAWLSCAQGRVGCSFP